jgi:hypothetical protein
MRSVLGLCAAFVSAGVALAAPSPFADAVLGFSATFPSTSEREDSTQDTDAGVVTTTTIQTTTDSGDYFAVSVTRFGDALAEVPPQEILRGAIDGAVDNVGATVQSNTETTLDGYPARELIATASPAGSLMRVHSKVAFKNGALYQAITVDGADPNEAEVRAFLSSFRLKR